VCTVLGEAGRKRQRWKEAAGWYRRALEAARTAKRKDRETVLLMRLAQCLEHVDQEAFLRCLDEWFRVSVEWVDQENAT
jgi:hypothetical protein